MSIPEMISVESSNVDSVGYDAAKRVVYIRFKDNALYAYYDVPNNIFDELLKSNSVGAYLHKNIKGKFKYEQIE